MTDLSEDDLYPEFQLVKDSEDNIHLIYTIYLFDEPTNSMNPNAIYQKFSRTGEALTESIFIMELAEIPDTFAHGNQCRDMWISDDDELVILFSAMPYNERSRFYYFSMDVDCNTIDSGKELEGLRVSGITTNRKIEIVKDSNDEIIVSNTWRGSYVVQGDTVRPRQIFYQRYDSDGNQLGSTHWPVGLEGEPHDHNLLEIDSEDNLHIFWRDAYPGGQSYFYSKISSTDSALIDNFRILAEWDAGSISVKDVEFDSEDQLVLLCGEAISQNDALMSVRKYDAEMEILFKTFISEKLGDNIVIDSNDEIHTCAFFTNEDERTYIGYSHIDNDGAMIDSALSVHGETRIPRTIFSKQIYACDDGLVGVLWFDYRHEIMLSYNTFSSVDTHDPHLILDYKLFPTYPNPFNSSVVIPFSVPRGDYTHKIMDISGRVLLTQYLSVNVPGLQHIIWNGTTNSDRTLPNGQYIFSIANNKTLLARPLLLIK